MWAVVAVLCFVQATDPTTLGMKALEDGKYDAAVEAFIKAIAD